MTYRAVIPRRASVPSRSIVDVCSSSTLSPFLFNGPPSTEIYTLSLHDALPISTSTRPHRRLARRISRLPRQSSCSARPASRSEEHTSELQSRFDLVCRLLLEKKKQGAGCPIGRADRISAYQRQLRLSHRLRNPL